MSLVILIILASIIVLFFAFFFCVCLFEKHPIKQFVPVEWESLSEPSRYFLAVNESARTLRFEFIGALGQAKRRGLYGAYLSVWLSPDGLSVLRICGGKTAGVPEKKMILTSYLMDNHMVESSDLFLPRDLTDITDRQMLLHAHLEELYPFHQRRLAAQSLPTRPIEKSRALDILEFLAAMKARRLKELGLGRFTNPEQTIWCYSFKGAWKMTANLLKVTSGAGIDVERGKLKRPGDV